MFRYKIVNTTAQLLSHFNEALYLQGQNLSFLQRPESSPSKIYICKGTLYQVVIKRENEVHLRTPWKWGLVRMFLMLEFYFLKSIFYIFDDNILVCQIFPWYFGTITYFICSLTKENLQNHFPYDVRKLTKLGKNRKWVIMNPMKWKQLQSYKFFCLFFSFFYSISFSHGLRMCACVYMYVSIYTHPHTYTHTHMNRLGYPMPLKQEYISV